MTIRSAVLLVCALALAGPLPMAAQDSPQTGPMGRLAGRVVDRDNGRPLAGVRIELTGPHTAPAASTDFDGRYRTEPLPAGVYTLRATYIGYQAVRIDSATVTAERTEVVDIALKAVPFELSAVSVEAVATPRPSSEAGLLSMQQAAPAVSDGVSAETIKRTPDANASDALKRVTGVSIVEGKFVIVRGLPERYSNTLLNGAELVSTEPVKRIVPLDIFPASLLESIVTTKTATPDRPGDFSGGSVSITTKEFPEQFVMQFNVSQAYNSRSTFHSVPLVGMSSSDRLGFDNGRRAFPAGAPGIGLVGTERFAESIRNVWTPEARDVTPDLGLKFNVGGRSGESHPLGYIFAWTYNERTTFNPDRLYFLYPDANGAPFRSLRFTDSHASVDWGTVFNLTFGAGAGAKFGWKNLYTRQTTEDVVRSAGYEVENNRVTQAYQVRYVAEHLLQTQLTGDHRLGLFGSRFEWKGTLALAGRDEPDNRQAVYSSGKLDIGFENPTIWTRFLTDKLWAAQADWSIPVSLRQSGDAQIKLGGLYRRRDRDFDSRYFEFRQTSGAAISDPALAMPPEQAFAPENIGRVMELYSPGGHAEPYGADDDVDAAYAMVDVPIIPALRLVGGVRYEDWRLNIFPGGRGAGNRAGGPGSQRAADWLWSFNGTLRLSDRMNFRFAGFRSVARPDAREITANVYQGVVGECAYAGNPDLVHTWINNGDVRWELYPRPGELIAVSAFYKGFHYPIVEMATYPDGRRCLVTYRNATYAQDYGVEVELRKSFGPFGVSANVTRVKSIVQIDTVFGNFEADLPLQGQSPWIANGMLSFNTARVGATVSINYFSDRVARYGIGSAAIPEQAPNLLERSRATVDAKVQLQLPRRITLSLAGKNLTNQSSEFIHRATAGVVLAQQAQSGVGASIEFGYAF